MKFLYFFILFSLVHLSAFEKVVLWGHKLHSHTHSYIHYGFFRAFKELGYEVYWFDDSDDLRDFDFSRTLFITEGQVDQNIPMREDCDYVIHNCDFKKYRSLANKNQVIILQVYTDDILQYPGYIKIAPAIYYNVEGKTLIIPWATDLLPHEIDKVKNSMPHIKKGKNIIWVGTFSNGQYGNESELFPFIRAAKAKKCHFRSYLKISPEENITVVSSAYMAPTIVGEWQKKKGYIPCRIFKNISYGQLGITNSKRVYEVMEGKIVYNPDPYQLFLDAEAKLNSMSMQEMYDLMDFVKEKHTYINRVHTILEFFALVKAV